MLVFDATAIEALFHAYPPVFLMWQSADEGRATLGFPALAVVEAGMALGVPTRSWDALLWPPSITVLPLGVTAAVEIPTWSGNLGARHALWEARALHCPLVTRQPDLYASGVADIYIV